MKKKTLAVFVVFVGVTIFSRVSGNAEEITLNLGMLQEIVDLVMENNFTLQSQRSLVERIQALPDPGRGLDLQLNLAGGMAIYAYDDDTKYRTGPTGSAVLEFPLFSSSRRKDRIMDRITYAKELEKARQDYLRLKKSIVSELLAKVKHLFQLENEKRKLEELRSFLRSNTESLKEQVKTGVTKADDLWELTERIMDTETKIYNCSSDLEILRQEVAINLGGEKSEQLRQMLEELSIKYVEGGHLD